MNPTNVALSLATGLLVGALFGYFDASIPAPPNLAGVMGIVGIFAGYRLMNWLGWSYPILDALGF